jgi:CheY-like chemotaxis protein
LVVEDEDSLRVMVESILKRHGYLVLTAANGVEALQVWEQCQGEVDLLLTDMVMPEGLTGRQLADRLKEQKTGLKVIYTSGYSVDLISDQREALREGLNFLQKPYHPQLLTETVRSCLDSISDKPEETPALQRN